MGPPNRTHGRAASCGPMAQPVAAVPAVEPPRSTLFPVEDEPLTRLLVRGPPQGAGLGVEEVDEAGRNRSRSW